MQVVGADGSDLGAVGTLQCKITIGDIEVEQTFIVCQHLRRNVILGTDFAKENQAGVSWMRQGTRILSVKGEARLEVEEDELGIPVTTKYHVKIPPRYSAVFEVNLHGNCEGTKIISANKQLMEMNPKVFQPEILIKPDGKKMVTEAHFTKVSKEDRAFLKIIVSVCGQEPVTECYTNMYMVHLSKDENSKLIKNEIILQQCSTIIINSDAFSFKYSGTNLGYPVTSVFCELLEVSLNSSGVLTLSLPL